MIFFLFPIVIITNPAPTIRSNLSNITYKDHICHLTKNEGNMNNEKIASKIESTFRKKVQNDKKLHNAYLLVHSEKYGIHLNIAEGSTGKVPADPQQPVYMASVGKIFTSVLISMLYEQGKLSFVDGLDKYLDADLLKNLHVFKGKDYTKEIKIRHLLTHTSGLYDSFWPLLNQMLENPDFNINPKDAITWGKENQKPYFPPGKKMKYTDTNYYLLGLIIEEITGKEFHEILHEYIFDPLGMRQSYMLHVSDPIEKPSYPLAKFFMDGRDISNIKSYAGIDYAGGGVVARPEDLLIFMKALVNYQIIKKETLEIMKNDHSRFLIFHEYGYGVMHFKGIPLLMPNKLSSWGHAGATGAFMFYNPTTESIIIGNFNDASYTSKGVQFMLSKILSKLVKCE